MNKGIIKIGLRLLVMSIIFRILSFIYFSFSWQWPNQFFRSIEILIGILFLIMWFIYGFIHRVGFKKGIIIGTIGIIDAIILLIVTLIMFINRGPYYPGAISMIPWLIPFLGILNKLSLSDFQMCFIPLIVIMITGIGSYCGSKYFIKIEKI